MQESNPRDAIQLRVTRKINGSDHTVWWRSGRERCCRTSGTSAEGRANLEKRRESIANKAHSTGKGAEVRKHQVARGQAVVYRLGCLALPCECGLEDH